MECNLLDIVVKLPSHCLRYFSHKKVYFHCSLLGSNLQTIFVNQLLLTVAIMHPLISKLISELIHHCYHIIPCPDVDTLFFKLKLSNTHTIVVFEEIHNWQYLYPHWFQKLWFSRSGPDCYNISPITVQQWLNNHKDT